MDPRATGEACDRIASRFHETRRLSCYGVDYLRRAVRHAPKPGLALNAGCGTGIAVTQHLMQAGF